MASARGAALGGYPLLARDIRYVGLSNACVALERDFLFRISLQLAMQQEVSSIPTPKAALYC